MLLSTMTKLPNYPAPLRDKIKLLKEAGFQAFDLTLFHNGTKEEIVFSDDYREKARELRRYADSIGIVCNQSHAVFPTSTGGARAG